MTASNAIYQNKTFNVDEISMKFVPEGSIANKIIIGSGDGLVPNRQQAIIWTNDDQDQWRHMGQVTKLWLSCYLVLLSIDSKSR